MSDEKIAFDQFKTDLGLYVEDPWERVKFIFMKNDHGELHPDLVQALQTAEVGFLGGGGLGGIYYQNKFLEEYKERNDAKSYHNISDAGREMGSESLKGFLRGALKWGPRTAVFTSSFTLFASCVQAYRNKYGVLEYSVGGTVAGGLLKYNFGIRGMLVGSLVGMVLGTVYGVFKVGMCKLTGTDEIEMKYGQYALSKYIKKQTEKNGAKTENSELWVTPQSNESNLNPLSNWEDEKEPKNNKKEENLK